MRTKTLASLLSIAVGLIAAADAGAAENPVAPQMYSGYSHRPPQTWTVSPTADQTMASDVIGADLKNAEGTTIAKIADLIIDPRNATAGVAIITPAGLQPFDHGKDSAIAWSSLEFEPKPTPHFVTKLDQAALDAGTKLVGKTGGAAYLDVKKDLLGKEVIGRDGAPLGHVQNLVLTFGTGHLVALVVNTGGGFITMGGANDHAVAWSAAQPQAGTGGGPIHIALTKSQVEGAPVTATMAPAPIGPRQNDYNVEYKRDVTGNLSGTKVPAPQNGR
jgi:sporulation protein YlmC with PRC-barrel domain